MKTINFIFVILFGLSTVYAFVPATSFDLNTFFVQTVVQRGDVATNGIQFLNLDKDQNFYLTKNGNFFDISSDSIFVKSRDSGNVMLTFNTTNLDEGVYVGNFVLNAEKGDSVVVPVVLGVKSRQLLFDITSTVSPQFSVVAPGDRLVANIQLYNLGSLDKNINLSYYVVDLNGSVIVSDSQVVQVGDKLGIVRDLYLPPKIPSGDYVFYATARKGSSFGLSSFLFTVSNSKSSKTDYSFFIVLVIAVILLILFLLFSWIWKRRLVMNAKYWDNKVSELKRMKTGNTSKKLRKLEYELQLLETARLRGYIKSNSYKETKDRLLQMIRESKKRL